MEYNFKAIERSWQEQWEKENLYKVTEDNSKPKFYILDMFPYPSGAGLHVGHPLGYIASDIYARYKHATGYNVLHPMGFDAFGLPAEQYAIQTGQHPAVTTEQNINRYKEQLGKIGFNYDWSREIRTSSPAYYKWTQWVFIQLFNSWYDNQENKAKPITELVKYLSENGTQNLNAAQTENLLFSAEEWNRWDETKQQEILLNYRLAYIAETYVNWCPQLGTVLANDEVSNGVSVRGGYPVEQKKMKQWILRVSAYAQRLLDDLETLAWTDAMKEIQRNWIGRSEGAELNFKVADSDLEITVFTTRPDTLFGVSFMVLAPESDYVTQVVSDEQKDSVEAYLEKVKKRTERERMAEVDKVTGVFSGSYAIHPLTNKKVPIWIADYVLAGYGTGAVMAVPAHDSRDFAFAKHFDLPILQVVTKDGETMTDTASWTESYDSKEGILINSDFLNGLRVKDAMKTMIQYLGKNGLGTKQINYRLRDAIFSRQRYWGEPFPIYYKNNLPYTIPVEDLPLELPEVDNFLPTEDGQPPLARNQNWKTKDGYPLEVSTMPGFAGSSGYYLRYMDPHNDTAYFSKEANAYWRSVDLYVGGTEHATGHLIYARFWNKFLYDIGLTVENEPFKKLINQGMIQGRSNFVHRLDGSNIYLSKQYVESKENELEKIVEEKLGVDIRQYRVGDGYSITDIHVDISLVDNDILDIEAFKKWRPEFSEAVFVTEDDGKYRCSWAVEKMSKSMFNVVNPDDIIEQYGADTLRLYEMFLGPIEQHKPWNTNGIDGVHKFLKKFWRLFFNDEKLSLSEEQPNNEEYKILHKTIKKVRNDIEDFSFNTSVSAFMIAVNELQTMKCNKRQILEPLTILLSPFAPHITEELWHLLGHDSSIYNAVYPDYDESYLVENTFEYPVSFNGKMRFKIDLPVDMPQTEIEQEVLKHEKAQKWLEGKSVRKFIVVPKRIINVVVG